MDIGNMNDLLSFWNLFFEFLIRDVDLDWLYNDWSFEVGVLDDFVEGWVGESIVTNTIVVCLGTLRNLMVLMILRRVSCLGWRRNSHGWRNDLWLNVYLLLNWGRIEWS